MSDEKGSITIKILGKEYPINCPASEAEGLQKSANYLNEQMSLIKTKGATLSFEKVAVLAGLNISHELIKQGSNSSASKDDSQKGLKQLEAKIDQALSSARQMEI